MISSENWIKSVICTMEQYKLQYFGFWGKAGNINCHQTIFHLASFTTGQVKIVWVWLEEMVGGIRMLVSIVIII
jgi:hypothetical protein